MNHTDYIVTTSRNNRHRKLFWDGKDPLAVDHPATWVLEKTPHGVFARCLLDGQAPLEFSQEDLQAGRRYDLPRTPGVSVSLKTIKPIRAAYHPAYYPKGMSRPPQFFIFTGQRYLMTNYEPVADSYKGVIEGKPIWGYVRSGGGYQVTTFRDGVKIRLPSDHRQSLKAGATITINDADFIRATFSWQRYWWRVNRIPTPEALPAESFQSPEKQERQWFIRFSAVVTSILIIGFAVVKRISEDYKAVEIPAPPATITLKTPKIIPKLKKPEPKVVKKEPPKKPEPPKVAKKEPPKKKEVVKKAPPKKVVTKKPPPPKPLAKAPPPPKPAPPKPMAVALPKPVAPAPPRTSVAPPAPVAKPTKSAELIQRENAAKQQAAKTQQLARALNFLSPSVNKKASGGVFIDKTSDKYNAGGPSAVSADKSAKGPSILNSIASNQTQQGGPIDTKSARNVISDKFAGSGERGKGLNDVQGKVSLQALYDPNAGADLGGAMSGGSGLTMSGTGQMSESELQKALAKHLQRFQYCYEKALLNDPTLGGTVTMQWTIQPGGSASDVRVARSQIKHAGLHACMSKELKNIRFPSPKGGSVTVKFPFAFTASTI